MREVIIVTYYWPPSGGGGVQRWLKFAKYLPEFGFKPIIVTPEKPDFPFRDDSLAKDISPDIEVIKLPIWEPYGIFRKLSVIQKPTEKQGQALDKTGRTFLDWLAIWIRGNLFIPDPRVFWVRPVSRFLLKFLNSKEQAVLVTTGPPHSIHLIGLRVSRRLNIKWVADFRDPWGEWFQLRHLKVSKAAMRIHRRMERKVAQNAHRITTVGDAMRDYYDAMSPGNVDVIRNGFDAEDFSDLDTAQKRGKFIMTHTGTIDDLRNPRYFLNAYRQLCLDDPEFRETSIIRFIGIISESYLAEYLDDPLLGSQIELEDYVEHAQIGARLRDSTVLLLLLSDFGNNAMYTPGKFYEYLAAQRPILALVPEKGEAARIIEATRSGLTCDPSDEESIKESIKSLYSSFRSDKPFQPRNFDRFDRRNLTSKLANILESL